MNRNTVSIRTVQTSNASMNTVIDQIKVYNEEDHLAVANDDIGYILCF